MNIFILSEDPIQAAQYQCNKHVIKMIVESAQLLCTALILQGHTAIPYKATHKNHPCAIWARECSANMQWLLVHGLELCAEYTRRYHKAHRTQAVLEKVGELVPIAKWQEHTPFVLAMPDQYKQNDAVTAYRAYYLGEKAEIAQWEPRSVKPDWWNKNVI